MKSIFERQNDETALIYLRAAKYCARQKLIITYYMIIVSLLTTGISIAIKYLQLPEIYSTLILLFSGVVLISNIFCAYLKQVFNKDNVNLLERCDIYVFDLPANKAMLKPLAEQSIMNYAGKIKRKKTIEKLKNSYFKTEEEVAVKNLYMTKAKNNLAYNHRLMINVRVFFMLLWLGFFVFLIAVAFFLDNAFTDTVINVFIPSLSAISLIVSSWIAFNEQISRLNNVNNVIRDIFSGDNKKDAPPSLNSQVLIRSVQDTVFTLRLSSFSIPEFLIRRFDKKLICDAELIKEQLNSQAMAKTIRNTTAAQKLSSAKRKKLESGTSGTNFAKSTTAASVENAANGANGANAVNAKNGANGANAVNAKSGANGANTVSAATPANSLTKPLVKNKPPAPAVENQAKAVKVVPPQKKEIADGAQKKIIAGDTQKSSKPAGGAKTGAPKNAPAGDAKQKSK